MRASSTVTGVDAVRELDSRRTPTVLILDSAGRVARRASGLPTGADVRSAVRPLLEVS
ncbi:MAG: hypothetical protein H0V10_04040 [Geodermatophilaceae bacterium]|nr:hypothetical protein [Geodermatophilaceae bacterium]